MNTKNKDITKAISFSDQIPSSSPYRPILDWYLALAAYNTGENRVKSQLMKAETRDYWSLVKSKRLYRETRNYVPFFLAASIIGKDPQKYGFYVPPKAPLQYDIVEIEKML